MHPISTLLPAIALLLALSACGGRSGGDASSAKANAGTPDKASATSFATATPRTQTGKDRSKLGDCDLLTADDIVEAFGGKLTIKRISGGNAGRSTGCVVDLAEGESGQIIMKVESRAVFELRRDSAKSQSGVRVVPVDLGVEGHLLNDAQVIAIDAQDRAISIGLQLIVFGQPTPITREESAEGVQLLVRRALERL